MILASEFQSQNFGLSDQKRKFNIGFQDGGCGSRLKFSIKTISAVFDLHVAPILATKF